MRALLIVLTLFMSTKTHADVGFCLKYAGLLGDVVERKNNGTSHYYQELLSIEKIRESTKGVDWLLDEMAKDISRIYKIEGYIDPEMLEQETVKNCLIGSE